MTRNDLHAKHRMIAPKSREATRVLPSTSAKTVGFWGCSTYLRYLLLICVVALFQQPNALGQLWPEVVLDETGFEPTVATNGSGIVVVAWYDREGTVNSIKRRRHTYYAATPPQWEQAGNVSGPNSVDPALAYNPYNGDFYFGWWNLAFGSSIFKFRRSPDGSNMDDVQTVEAAFSDRPWLEAFGLSVYANWNPQEQVLRFKRGVVDPDTKVVDWSGNATEYAHLTNNFEGYVFAPPAPIARGAGTEGQADRFTCTL